MSSEGPLPAVPLLTPGREVLKASSVLNRNVKEFAVGNIVDGSPDTCWNSDTVRVL